jgi:hypothetical protein
MIDAPKPHFSASMWHGELTSCLPGVSSQEYPLGR